MKIENDTQRSRCEPRPLQKGVLEAADAVLTCAQPDVADLAKLQESFDFLPYLVRDIEDWAAYWRTPNHPIRQWIRATGAERDIVKLAHGSKRRKTIKKYSGDKAIAYIVKELILNIVDHSASTGLILLRVRDAQIEIVARDTGLGIRDVAWSMEEGHSKVPRLKRLALRLWGKEYNAGKGLPYARNLTVFGGRGVFCVMSNGHQLTYRDAFSFQTSTSIVKRGTLVHVLRDLPST